MMRRAVGVMVCLCLAGCEPSYDDQLDALNKLVAERRMGISEDYWLTKTNAFGQADRVALVFGLMGDAEFCQDLATLYMQKYPADRYYCLAANR